jgi:hypothetical protein
MTATLVKELYDPEDVASAPIMGSVQSLDTGNTFIGYGYAPKMKEYDSTGNVVMGVQFGTSGERAAYRSYRQTWIGKPTTAPSVYACHDGENTQVYMSWNGSTEHTAWSVMCGDEPRRMHGCKTTRSSGFETVCQITGKRNYVQVEPEGRNVSPIKSTIVKVDSQC